MVVVPVVLDVDNQFSVQLKVVVFRIMVQAKVVVFRLTPIFFQSLSLRWIFFRILDSAVGSY